MNKRFTLIELLVVVAIIGILVSFLLPSLSKARKQAQIGQAVSNMKQITVAMYNYTDDNDSYYVRSRSAQNLDYSWDDYLSSYLGISMSQTQLDSGQPDYRRTFEIFNCPLDNMSKPDGYFTRTFALNAYKFGGPRIFALIPSDPPSLRVQDINVPSETIMQAEQAKALNYVGHQSNTAVTVINLQEVSNDMSNPLSYNPNHHNNGFRNAVSFIDGHVRVMSMLNTLRNNNYLWWSQKP